MEATFQAIKDYFDFWNVDLAKHEYFKNLPSQKNKLLHPYENNNDKSVEIPLTDYILEYFQKKKAILDYIGNLFFGTSPFNQESEILFDPRFGKAWRPYFIRKYGWQGQKLIEALGKGHSLEFIQKYGIPNKSGSGNEHISSQLV